MASQPPAILRFLLATSILDRFCAPLCESVLGSAAGRDGSACDVPACIQWLERHNLFVIPLDDHRQWYRYHHLFQELLQRRLLNEAGPEQVAELHRRAAAWFEERGLIDEAIRHALAINDLDLAAELMVAGLCDVLNREDRVTLDRWLRLLPEDFVQRHPWLLMMKVVAVEISWQLAADVEAAGPDRGAAGRRTQREGPPAPWGSTRSAGAARDHRRLAGPGGVRQRPGRSRRRLRRGGACAAPEAVEHSRAALRPSVLGHEHAEPAAGATPPIAG